MPYKTCTYCFQVTYSANQHGHWLCPHCGTDLSRRITSEKPEELIKEILPDAKSKLRLVHN